ncbi:DNA polymerase III subunit gamma/tau [Candidatus Microgenomates bacterium]|nr:DNA polymerase III subunit gamma/tau [Candidatus Microgenomates bacterium]
MTFYLEYRPKNIDELDITSVRESLGKIIKSGHIPHAFLFAGPKGTGKTSAARILAKVINCEAKLKIDKKPCNKCGQCKSITSGTNIDVLEMDAASNRGIDDIRALRDVVKLSPASALAKVYIIDEAHMLTTEACNALLKTLEEPPEHVYFILATTNPEKLIETIRSRTTLISFQKATNEEIIRSLKRIVRAEKIKIIDKNLDSIVKISKGSFRDAVKLLERVVSEGLGFLKAESVNLKSLLEAIESRDIKKILSEISSNVQNGVLVSNLMESILDELRSDLLATVGIGEKNTNLSKTDLLELIRLLIQAHDEIKISPIEQLPLELVFVRWVGGMEEEEEEEEEVVENQNMEEGEVGDEIEIGKDTEVKKLDETTWKKFLAAVKPVNASIEALLRSSKLIGFEGDDLCLGVYYKFHKEKLEELKTKKILEDIATQILHRKICLRYNLSDQPEKTTEAVTETVVLTEGEDEDIIKAAEDIFS